MEKTWYLKFIAVWFILVLFQVTLKLLNTSRLTNVGQSLASWSTIKDKFFEFAVRNRNTLILIVIYTNDRGTILLS